MDQDTKIYPTLRITLQFCNFWYLNPSIVISPRPRSWSSSSCWIPAHDRRSLSRMRRSQISPRGCHAAVDSSEIARDPRRGRFEDSLRYDDRLELYSSFIRAFLAVKESVKRLVTTVCLVARSWAPSLKWYADLAVAPQRWRSYTCRDVIPGRGLMTVNLVSPDMWDKLLLVDQ